MTWGFGVSYWYIVAGHPEYIPSSTGIYQDICDMGLWDELYWYIEAGHPEYIPSKTGIYRDICDMGLWGELLVYSSRTS